ncbi:MAG: 4Fe-4S binding protein [Desulfobacteraceae bacterium]|nr:4Fe-4S binding protein [Desulfobacteraceae bacterium]
MRFRRTAQLISLAIFLLALALSRSIAVSDLFIRMDPALIGTAALAGRKLAWTFLPAAVVLLSAIVFGRIFCGYICPMGTTIDAADYCFSRPSKKRGNTSRISLRLKYCILAFTAGSALFGVTFVFWAAPLALITRFYGLVIYPVVLLILKTAVSALYPMANFLDIQPLMFAEIPAPRYATQMFVLLFFAAVFAAAKHSPRFWCRYICPSGALLALASKKPAVRRLVSPECDLCGLCVSRCPMGAIYPESPEKTRHSECIVCRTCAQVCPQKAIEFGTNPGQSVKNPEGVYPQRRKFLISGLAGAGTAAVTLTGLNVVVKNEAEKGVVRPARLIRPPGALPEPDFLALCVRCGQCMAACPTNTLQPVWFEAGMLGIFSPAVIPRRKYCDPHCTACGDACPTGAVRQINTGERIWAKIGTAIIYRQQCLAWEYKKSCMVCDEVCPYNAVEFENRPGYPYPVPHVTEDKCSGCGHCEHACPVYNRAAIVVTPMNSMRLRPGQSFEYEAEIRGFNLSLEEDRPGYTGPEAYPTPGAQDEAPGKSNELPPGFDQGG